MHPTDQSPDLLHEDVERLTQELEETRHLLVELETESRTLREELARLKTSAAGRLTIRLQQSARRAAPYGSRRQRALHEVAQSAAVLVEEGPRALVRQIARRRHGNDLGSTFPDSPAGRLRQYHAWLDRHEPREAELGALRSDQDSWTSRPLVSLLMPVRDPETFWLEEAIESVQAQIYPHWELCLADDASTRGAVRNVIDRFAAGDNRIKTQFRESSGGIAAATNSALALATGEWIGFLDHDDVLRPRALHAMVSYLQEHPYVDVCYSDEDKILPSGERGDPLFKPDWSPEMLLSSNYITHFVIARKHLIDAVGGLREGFDGGQDHDLLLRVTELANEIGHVADVLYSWRMVTGSAALSSDFKPLARESGRRAVEQALERRGLQGRVEFGTYPGFYNLRYAVDDAPSVAIVIPTRDHVELVRAAIGSIERESTYQNYSIVIVNNQSRRPETLSYLANTQHRVIDVDRPFNFSTLVNAAAAEIDADHLLLLNNDVAVITPGWIEAMLVHSQRSDVGAVGARLVYSDGRAQHEGIVLGRLHEAANVEMKWPGVREVSAVTGACLMTRCTVFRDVGGFDETLAEAFNDVDYCLRVRQAGYRVVYTPLAELSHREGASRGRRIPPEDRSRFVQRWGDESQIRDPYLNVNVLWPNPLRLRLDESERRVIRQA
jgi:GT2 family glycosyltransferase